MIRGKGEDELVALAVGLAARTRNELEGLNISILDCRQVSSHYGVNTFDGPLPEGRDGSYVKESRTIVLSTASGGVERRNFTFAHELMHARIEDDDDVLSEFADAATGSSDELMERMCNAGAAELLIPAAKVREFLRREGFSTQLIPLLCDEFGASSIAVALQMVKLANHRCYLVIAELREALRPNITLWDEQSEDSQPAQRLVVALSSKSSSAKYHLGRNQVITARHAMHDALAQPKRSIQARDSLPLVSGKEWRMGLDAIYYRDRVFAFFNETEPVSPDQLELF